MINTITVEPLRIVGAKSSISKYTDDLINYLQVVKLYREDLSLLQSIENTQNSGVYVLIGSDEDGRTMVYTGESENPTRRIATEHIKSTKKNFFSEVFVVTTTDNSLNKAEILHLENLLYNRFKLSPNVKIANEKTTTSANLSNRQASKINIFAEVIVNILSVATNCNFIDLRFNKPDTAVFTLRGLKSVGITATYSNGKMTIHKDSIISGDVANSAPNYVKSKRNELIEQSIISPYKDMWIVNQDFDSDNVARLTNILTGSSVSNAETKWLNCEGLNLKQYIEN